MTTSRREWLTLLGASATAAIAGCSGDDDQDGSESEDEEESEDESDGMTDTPVSEIALSREDLSDEFRVQDRTPRTESDVDDSALERGWEEGYRVEFVRNDGNVRVEHRVSRYPPENISDLFEDDFRERFTSSIDGTVEQLPDPDIGTHSEGYRLEVTESDVVGFVIRTARADIYQTILLLGEGGSDYEFAKELAQRATANVG